MQINDITSKVLWY